MAKRAKDLFFALLASPSHSFERSSIWYMHPDIRRVAAFLGAQS